MRRILIIGLLLFGALVVQVSVFPWFQFMGSIPEIVLAVVILLGIFAGPATGAAAGFAGGLLQDLFVRAPTVGMAALAFTIVGYAAGATERMMMRSSPLIIPGMVFGFVIAGELIYLAAGLIAGAQISGGRILPAALYTVLLSVPLIPLVRRVCEATAESAP